MFLPMISPSDVAVMVESTVGSAKVLISHRF